MNKTVCPLQQVNNLYIFLVLIIVVPGAKMSGTLTRGSTTAPLRTEVPAEAPFLVNNKEKWISGIVEETPVVMW